MWYSAVGCLVTLTLSLLVAPLTARAQPRGKLPLIGVLEPGSQPPRTTCLPAFQQGLRDLGYVEGQNIQFEYRYAANVVYRLPALAAERIRKHLGIDLAPEQFIVIGDTPNDIDCAKHFGARSLAVGTGRLYGAKDVLACKPDAFLPDFSNVELVMQTLAKL